VHTTSRLKENEWTVDSEKREIALTLYLLWRACRML
jgi:hypothetical protein